MNPVTSVLQFPQTIVLIIRLMGVLIFLVVGSPAVRAADDSPALNHLTNLLATHHYHQVLKETSTLLNLNPSLLKQKKLDRYNVMKIRAESLLKLKLFSVATNAYRAVAQVAPTIRDTRVARATAALISHSAVGYYVPISRLAGTAPPSKINIERSASRQQAMQAFYQDQWKTLKPRIAAAQSDSSLNPIIDLLSSLRIAVDAETAAQDPSSNDLKAKSAKNTPAAVQVDSTSNHMVNLMRKALNSMRADTIKIQKSVNAKIIRIVNGRRNMVRRGITRSQAEQLENIVRTCQDIQTTIRDFNQNFSDFPKDTAAMNVLKKYAKQTYHTTQSMLPS